MSNDNKSIHEFDFNLICEYFTCLERQGPGSEEVTLKALSFIDNLSASSLIADLGCGTGGQTMVLARHVPGLITGIDLSPVFIDRFNRRARELKFSDRVKGIVGSMDQLPFREEELDLIWSEGAIYNIGFEQGLRLWKRFLKPGGYIAVSEASYFTPQRPREVEDFWQDADPGIDTIPEKVRQMQEAGYSPVAHFTLPENCWTENFYVPQVEAHKVFLEKHKDKQAALGLVENLQHEAQVYNRYKDYYGYAFYIGKKIA